MNKRQYGDEMVERVIYDLQQHDLPVEITKGSGSVKNNLDALMPIGMLAFEGKASSVSKSLTCMRSDFKKAEQQAANHNRMACLVVENKKREVAAFLSIQTAEALNLNHLIDYTNPMRLNTKNWTLPPEWAVATLENKHGELVLAAIWEELFSEMLPTLRRMVKVHNDQ